jgi:hypothetical protein
MRAWRNWRGCRVSADILNAASVKKEIKNAVAQILACPLLH